MRAEQCLHWIVAEEGGEEAGHWGEVRDSRSGIRRHAVGDEPMTERVRKVRGVKGVENLLHTGATLPPPS